MIVVMMGVIMIVVVEMVVFTMVFQVFCKVGYTNSHYVAFTILHIYFTVYFIACLCISIFIIYFYIKILFNFISKVIYGNLLYQNSPSYFRLSIKYTSIFSVIGSYGFFIGIPIGHYYIFIGFSMVLI